MATREYRTGTDLMRIDKLAERLGMSVDYCYDLAREDRLPIPAIKIGRRWMFSREAYARLIDSLQPQEEEEK